jgi:hypothetical protein
LVVPVVVCLTGKSVFSATTSIEIEQLRGVRRKTALPWPTCCRVPHPSLFSGEGWDTKTVRSQRRRSTAPPPVVADNYHPPAQTERRGPETHPVEESCAISP